MIVCSCLGVSSSEIEELVEDGVDTVAAVGGACGAGTDCGACRTQVAEIIAVTRLLARKSCRGSCVAASEPISEGAFSP
jgi:bacterioferritin-associated ferredoxin